MSTAGHLAWRTSTRSSNGEKCVEVAPAGDGVLIRHSKRPADGTITFAPSAWGMFLRETLGEAARPNGVATIVRDGSDTLVRAVAGGVVLRFDAEEWAAFRAGAAAGEFDFSGEYVSA